MCVSVSSVGFVQYSQSGVGVGGSVHAFLPGSGAPDAAIYTKEDAPRRGRGRKRRKEKENEGKKEKKKRPIFVCVVLSFSCMLRLAGVRE